MASRCHGNKCSYRLLPVCGGETRWASSVRRKWKMKRKMEVNYIRSYPGLGAAVTQYNGHYWQAAKTHSVQCRAVLSQRLYASAIYMQFLFFFFFLKKVFMEVKDKKASGKFNSFWGVLRDMLFCSICLFGQVCYEALQNQTAPAALALTAFLKAYKGCRRAIMRTWEKQSKSVCVCLREGEILWMCGKLPLCKLYSPFFYMSRNSCDVHFIDTPVWQTKLFRLQLFVSCFLE